MSTENDGEKFQKIYDNLHKILGPLNEYVKNFIVKFDEDWKLGVTDKEFLEELQSDSKWEFEDKKSKVMRNENKSILFGETSAGKSTLINALLGKNDFPNQSGRTTNCFVEARRSSIKERSFVRTESKDDDECQNLKSLTNFKSKDRLEDGSLVGVYYRESDCPFLTEQMIITDIPGVDTNNDLDKNIIDKCSAADIIILILNSTTYLKGAVKNYFKEFQTRFSKVNVFLIYNHWDQLDGEIDKEIIQKQHLEEAKRFFREDLKNSDDTDRIFFLSAKERMAVNKNKEFLNYEPDRKCRDEEFLKFATKLKEELKVNVSKKRCIYLEGLWEVVSSNVNNCEEMMEKIRNKIDEITEKSQKQLRVVDYSSCEIDSIIKPAYDRIIQKLMKIKNEKCEEIEDNKRKLDSNAEASLNGRGDSKKTSITNKIESGICAEEDKIGKFSNNYDDIKEGINYILYHNIGEDFKDLKLRIRKLIEAQSNSRSKSEPQSKEIKKQDCKSAQDQDSKSDLNNKHDIDLDNQVKEKKENEEKKDKKQNISCKETSSENANLSEEKKNDNINEVTRSTQENMEKLDENKIDDRKHNGSGHEVNNEVSDELESGKDNIKHSLLFIKKLYFPFYFNLRLKDDATTAGQDLGEFEESIFPQIDCTKIAQRTKDTDDKNDTNDDHNNLLSKLQSIAKMMEKESAKESLKEIICLLISDYGIKDELEKELIEIRNLNTESCRQPKAILTKLILHCYINPRFPTLSPLFNDIILKWIEKELTEHYLEFLQGIKGELLKRFQEEDKTFAEIKNDLEKVKQSLENMKKNLQIEN